MGFISENVINFPQTNPLKITKQESKVKAMKSIN